MCQKPSQGRYRRCFHLLLDLNSAQENDLLEVVRTKREGNDSSSFEPTITLRRNDFRSSTKLDALMSHLSKTPIARSGQYLICNLQDGFEIKTLALERSSFPSSRVSWI